MCACAGVRAFVRVEGEGGWCCWDCTVHPLKRKSDRLWIGVVSVIAKRRCSHVKDESDVVMKN